MFACATALLEANVEAINALNVFPVPDGDTGTNMFLTMREVAAAASAVQSSRAGDVAEAMARAAFSEARGNSGVILSQFFTGLAAGLKGMDDFGPVEFADALQEARTYSYRAVGDPVEGTILTVTDAAARAARERAADGVSVQELCEAICAAARDAVARTPTMLPVLREAGVVDAGGQGLSVLLEGVRRSIRGETTDPREIPSPEPVGVDDPAGAVSEDFLQTTEEEVYGYCTQFLIDGEDLDPELIRAELTSLTHSTVVVGDGTRVRVHVHALDPGPAVSYAVSQGTLRKVKIDNMDEQRQVYAVARRQQRGGEVSAEYSGPACVVAVAWGRGLERLFRSLGATEVLVGGDTMNPSVQEIVDAVERVPSDTVMFLPNNRNIVPAAEQAAALTQKTLKVIPSRTIPQGVAAILRFNPEKDPESNVAEMEEVLSSVRTGEVTTAVRQVTLGGVTVEEGQIIGLLEHSLVVAGEEPTAVLLALLEQASVADGDLITLYWGDKVDEEAAEFAKEQMLAAFPGVEGEVVEGAQPHYHYIVSVE